MAPEVVYIEMVALSFRFFLVGVPVLLEQVIRAVFHKIILKSCERDIIEVIAVVTIHNEI